jgi:hypothetical protein
MLQPSGKQDVSEAANGGKTRLAASLELAEAD